MEEKKSSAGFTLIEAVVAMGLFLIFTVGVYGSMQLVFKVVYQSRIRIIETAILNEQVEIVRNLPFQDVGILNGSPAGVLTRNVTTTRNGIPFLVTRTIRNIDDPFDGTIGGTPNDTAPADYKLVEIEVICTSCNQLYATSIATYVGPRHLEGDPSHGALFVHVFDAQAEPIQGAEVHITATSTNPVIDFIDTTDNDGMLRVVDLPQGIGAYDITVTKVGYTTDYTVRASAAVPNPAKSPASVVAQDVTEISFSIDRVSSVALSAIDAVCAVSPGVSVDMFGTKLIGMNPDILKWDESIVTDAAGAYAWPALDWDQYSLVLPNHDILGSIPAVPFTLPPDVDQPVSLVVGPNSPRSLLISVRDLINGQSLSNASVHVVASGYDETAVTGVGFLRQTDWSGGDGQGFFADASRYFSDDGNVEVADPAGDIRLGQIAGEYVATGSLESSVFDFGQDANYVNLIWEPLGQPSETGTSSLQFQIATNISATSTLWNYRGPDGTGATFYDAANPVIAGVHDGEQYLRYKAIFSSVSTSTSPILSDISLTYTNSCTPPGQVYFGNVPASVFTITVERNGYEPNTVEVTVDGDEHVVIDMAAEE